jgi:hypothetical protein
MPSHAADAVRTILTGCQPPAGCPSLEATVKLNPVGRQRVMDGAPDRGLLRKSGKVRYWRLPRAAVEYQMK